MIAGIPEGVLVRDYCLGLNWSYVEADCGMGVAFTVRGGGKRTYKMDLRGMELRTVAELSKSWCFQEATLGIARLKAEQRVGATPAKCGAIRKNERLY